MYKRVMGASIIAELSLGALVGGALGNMWDRVHIGFVTDFVDVKVWTETFNVADAAIAVGVITLALETLRRRSIPSTIR
jgi:signal peptidase II